MKDNAYMKRKNKHKIGQAGRKSENRLSKKLGGRLKPASGAMMGAKGDIEIKDVLIEAKATEADSYRLELTTLCKIKGEALTQNKVPALSVRFITGNGRARNDGSWYLIEESEFKEFLAYREHLDEI